MANLPSMGGEVNAYGGKAAGIGSGELDNGIYGSLTTNGGEITITDGKVEAHGGDYGAGIGGGQDSSGGTITISGGEVLAFGGTDAAGIGSGEEKSEDIDGGTITITGGYVMAEGKDAGAGLGAGEDAAMGNISISGGTVHAYGGVDSKAIYSNDMEYGANSLAISDNMMVSVGEFSGFTTKVITKEYFDIRGVETQNHRCASIEPCTHSDNGYTITDAIQHKINSCKYCLMGGLSEPHAFIDDYKCACGLLGLKDDADNTSPLAKWDNTTQTVALIGNTFQKDGTWSTICLPFNIDNLTGTPLEGASVMTLDKASFNSETLTLDFTDAVGGDSPTIEAGKPYVIKWGNDTEHPSIESPLFRNVTVGNTPPDDNAITTNLVTFKGLYAPMDIAENDHHNILYLGADNTLLYPEGATRINAFQAFFIANTNIGDVNGDNMVNITDVTSLVSLILSGNADNEVKKKADVTGDGMVNVTDVTTLVSYILSGKVDIVNVVVNGAEGITFK